jgi:hypothetical protein
MPQARLPGPDDRTAILGSTGAGKTVFALRLLSTRNYSVRPCYIFDFKGDHHIAQLPAHRIDARKPPPRRPGLYVLRPRPSKDEQSILEDFFWRVYSNEDAIVFIDEGTMIAPNNHGFRALQTQGRSKYIEVITCSQRPVKLLKEVMTEATFFAVFRLTNTQDRKTVAEWLPKDVYDPNTRLPERRCIWYDVGQDYGVELLPAPPPNEVIASFHAVVGRQKRAI